MHKYNFLLIIKTNKKCNWNNYNKKCKKQKNNLFSKKIKLKTNYIILLI